MAVPFPPISIAAPTVSSAGPTRQDAGNSQDFIFGPPPKDTMTQIAFLGAGLVALALITRKR